MPSPCNNVSVFPIKVSQLVRYSNLDGGDLLLTVESGSSLLSRRSTINDIKNSLGRLTGSYSGSFTGSFKGQASGSFSGSYWGDIISKNTKATGSFSGSYWGKLLSKNSKITGSFKGIDNILNFKGTGKKVSVNATSSYAISSSYALSSSYVVNGLNNGFGGLSTNLYQVSTSPTTLNAYQNSVYSISHTFGSTPSLIRATLICVAPGDVGSNYSIGDEISVEQLHDDTGGADDERPITSVWTNTTDAGVAFANWSGGVYTAPKTGGRINLLTTSWKVIIRIWK